VERLEKQLTLGVKTFAERLTDHGRRLDRLDQPPRRGPGQGAGDLPSQPNPPPG